MRVNGLLSITAGNTLVELYDDKCRYLAPITANEYFQESYDESFKEYDIDKAMLKKLNRISIFSKEILFIC